MAIKTIKNDTSAIKLSLTPEDNLYVTTELVRGLSPEERKEAIHHSEFLKSYISKRGEVSALAMLHLAAFLMRGLLKEEK